MKRLIAAASLIVTTVIVTANELSSTRGVIAHEWGTFTTVALGNGDPARWAPWIGKPDLPCFVLRTDKLYKWSVSGLVRMETPVIYFYSDRETKLSVDVQFPKGLITEWFPAATAHDEQTPETDSTPGPRPVIPEGGSIRWDNVLVRPGAASAFPLGKGESHYYAARDTDAAPITIGRNEERFLFYRGVGNFAVPLRARFPGDGKLEIRNAFEETIPIAIAFANEGGRVGYRVIRDLNGTISTDPPQLTADVEQLHRDLEQALVAAGLYEKEAAAMIATWRDSWFEEGTRVFYIVPRAQLDQVLPLNINPAPQGITRAFVGRVEVLSPYSRQQIRTALEARDYATLDKSGRFLEAFLTQMGVSPQERSAVLMKIPGFATSKTCVE